MEKALVEFEEFETARRVFEAEHPVSDFDRLIEETRRLDDSSEG